jgi:hypothetical protein
MVLDSAHLILGHLGSQRTSEYIRRWYWWPRIFADAEEYCRKCHECQTCKPFNKSPAGKLHPLEIPQRPWESIAMDFVGPFPEVEEAGIKYNYLWVITCRLTSMVHLVPVHTTTKASELAWLFIRDLVCLHGLPSSIISDRDSKFTSKFWSEVHRILGVKLLMSTSFHPQTDGVSERVNRTTTQILRSTVHPDQKDWRLRLPMTEFAINSSINGSTRYSPFFLNYGYSPSILKELPMFHESAPGVTEFAYHALLHLFDAHDSIIESRVFQTFYANRRRSPDLVLEVGDRVYLSTKNLALSKGRARKLVPKFIGPFPITSAHPESSVYTLELPEELRKRNIHPTFHINLLRPYVSSDDSFPLRTALEPYYFNASPNTEWFVNSLLSHRWDDSGHLFFEVLWDLGDITEESLAEVSRCRALDNYLALNGVEDPLSLPGRSSCTSKGGRKPSNSVRSPSRGTSRNSRRSRDSLAGSCRSSRVRQSNRQA